MTSFTRRYSATMLFRIGQLGRSRMFRPSDELYYRATECDLVRTRGTRAGVQHRLRSLGLNSQLNDYRRRTAVGSRPTNLINISTRQRSINGIHFATVNARSVRNCVNHLRHVILHDDLDILTITETWLRDDNAYDAAKLCPVGYTMARSDRSVGAGGGVAILCRDELKPKRIKTTSYMSFEHDIISVTSKAKRALIAVIYRPPASPIATFYEEFTSFLEDNALNDSYLVISGDFNIHWDNQDDSKSRELQSILNAFSLCRCDNTYTHKRAHN